MLLAHYTYLPALCQRFPMGSIYGGIWQRVFAYVSLRSSLQLDVIQAFNILKKHTMREKSMKNA